MKRIAGLVFSICLIVLSSSAEEAPREISVASDSWAWLSPDSARITVAVEVLAVNAKSAQEQLDSRFSKSRRELERVLAKDFRLEKRDLNYLAAGSRPSPVGSDSQIKAKLLIGLETVKLDRLGLAIDSLLKSSGGTLVNVEHFVRNKAAEEQAAVNKAVMKGRVQAESIASSLGRKLGEIIQIDVSKEPAGRIIRERNKRGGPALQLSDEDLHIYANVRYKLE